MSRRTTLWLLGAAALVIGGVLLAVDQRLWDEGGPGIVGFELAGSEGRAREILAEWGGEGRDAARLSLWLDYAYLLTYGAFLALSSASLRAVANRRGWRRMATAGSAAIGLAIGGALSDAVEDFFLLLVLDRHGGEIAPLLAAVFAAAKFLTLAGAIAYLLGGLVRLAHAARPRLALTAVAAVAVLVAALGALNTWSTGRETKAAEASNGGRIVSLTEGDVNVREDGDAGDPPLVLIHGFASSTLWWDRVVPALARRHRVIRVDLLGHGGSQKPRDGYSMERQADLVAAVMRRLGVPKAPVVGHSMGGLVGAAVVERHPARVAALMTIGTPPDTDSAGADLIDRLGFLPVAGHAGWRLIPEHMVRAELEGTFAPQFDVPQELVDGVRAMTYSAYRGSGEASGDYRDERPLYERLDGDEPPVTVVQGSEDRVVDPASVERFRGREGIEVIVLEGAGHSPQLERPAATADLILDFARQAAP